MNESSHICPQSIPWHDIHQALTAFHREKCPDAPPPPIPLILAGWAYSSDEEKEARWQATIAWAATHGASHLIPDLTETDFYSPPIVISEPLPHVANEIPDWACSLVALGEKLVELVDEKQTHRLTLALCLPCMAYAAAFTGIGMVKKRFSGSSCNSHKERLESLKGEWVSLKKGNKTDVGILEFDAEDNTFQIRLEKHGLWRLIDEQDWPLVRPTGRDFNPNRRLNQQQKEKVEDQNRAISILGNLLSCNLWGAALDKSGRIFSIYGNKTRLTQELSESLFEESEASLGKILRPEGHSDYGESFHCALESSRAAMPEGQGELVILEGGRTLPDQLAASRHLHRVVLLARNAADYEDCAGLMMAQASLRISKDPVFDLKFPSSIGTLSFYHQ